MVVESEVVALFVNVVVEVVEIMDSVKKLGISGHYSGTGCGRGGRPFQAVRLPYRAARYSGGKGEVACGEIWQEKVRFLVSSHLEKYGIASRALTIFYPGIHREEVLHA